MHSAIDGQCEHAWHGTARDPARPACPRPSHHPIRGVGIMWARHARECAQHAPRPLVLSTNIDVTQGLASADR